MNKEKMMAALELATAALGLCSAGLVLANKIPDTARTTATAKALKDAVRDATNDLECTVTFKIGHKPKEIPEISEPDKEETAE